MKNSVMKDVIIIVMAILLGVIIYRSCTTEPETVEVPIQIEVPVPIIEKQFDTIEKPVPIYTPGPTRIDSTYYDQYVQLKDSIARDSIFRDAITIREYRETFEDDTIKIDVYSEVTGKLNKQQVDYKTKPRTIPLDTTLSVTLNRKKDIKIGIGAEMGVPTQSASIIYNDPSTGNIIEGVNDLVIKANVGLHFPRSVYSISYDTENRIWIGFTYKF